MALIFREHRGSLEESMKTAREIESLSAFKIEIQADKYVSYGYDRRLESATTAVIKDGAIIGFITNSKEVSQ